MKNPCLSQARHQCIIQRSTNSDSSSSSNRSSVADSGSLSSTDGDQQKAVGKPFFRTFSAFPSDEEKPQDEPKMEEKPRDEPMIEEKPGNEPMIEEKPAK